MRNPDVIAENATNGMEIANNICNFLDISSSIWGYSHDCVEVNDKFT